MQSAIKKLPEFLSGESMSPAEFNRLRELVRNGEIDEDQTQASKAVSRTRRRSSQDSSSHSAESDVRNVRQEEERRMWRDREDHLIKVERASAVREKEAIERCDRESELRRQAEAEVQSALEAVKRAEKKLAASEKEVLRLRQLVAEMQSAQEAAKRDVRKDGEAGSVPALVRQNAMSGATMSKVEEDLLAVLPKQSSMQPAADEAAAAFGE